MLTEYAYPEDEIREIPRGIRRNAVLFFILFFILPLSVCAFNYTKISDQNFWFGIGLLLLFFLFGIIFHTLSASIGYFTLRHKDDVITVTDQEVCLKAGDSEVVSIPLDDVSGVSYIYYAAGATIFYLESKSRRKRIYFSTSLNDFLSLVRRFKPGFEWPPETYRC